MIKTTTTQARRPRETGKGLGWGGGREGGEGFECERRTRRTRGGREKDFFELVSFFHPVTW